MPHERELVQAVLAGDERSYRRFVKQYEKLVFFMVNKLIDDTQQTEDLAQEIFMKVFKNLAQFKFDSKLSTWISQIAYRESVNYLKKSKRHSQSLGTLNEGYGIPDKSPSPMDLSTSKDLAVIVRKYIALLPEQYRHVLVLFHLDEYSYAEISKIAGMPEGTVKNYIFRGRKWLKEPLEPLQKTMNYEYR